MSWDGWTDNLHSQGDIDFAGIYGKDGNPWSQKGETLSPADVNLLQQIIKDGNKSSAFGSGVQLSLAGGTKWTLVRVEEDAVLIKGKDEKKDWSLTCIATTQALVIGCNKGTGNPDARAVNNKTRGLADSLKGSGY